MRMSAREVFAKGTDTFNAHDVNGFAAALADDAVFQAPGGIAGTGKEACVGYFAGWFAVFPDAHVDVHRLHVIEDVVVEEGTFTGTHQGQLRTPAGDFAPTGRSVRLGYIQVLRIRDGKHVSFNLMFDRLQMFEQLGLMPSDAHAPLA